jgi:hypothetical protein
MICGTAGSGSTTAPWMHLLHGSVDPLVFLVEGSRLFATTSSVYDALGADEHSIPSPAIRWIKFRAISGSWEICRAPLSGPASISLLFPTNIAISPSF